MKYLFISLLLLSQAASKKELSDVQKLRADLFILRSQLSDCQVKMVNIQLSDEQVKLLNDFRSTLGATDKEEFDWATKSFKEKK